MRHYEILANGCIPVFPQLDECPPRTMFNFPKDLIAKGERLFDEYRHTDADQIPRDAYVGLIEELLAHTRAHLTTEGLARYMLNQTGNEQAQRVLYLSGCTAPDYLRCATLHGFKSLLGSACHDYPKIQHVYTGSATGYRHLYGKGITYANLLGPEMRDDARDASVEEDIMNQKYDLIIYGSFHRGMPFHDLVTDHTPPNKVILMCGEDLHSCTYDKWLSEGHPVFVREL